VLDHFGEESEFIGHVAMDYFPKWQGSVKEPQGQAPQFFIRGRQFLDNLIDFVSAINLFAKNWGQPDATPEFSNRVSSCSFAHHFH